jgi:hypothetical protein
MMPLLDELEALGFAENTIVVLTADHGDLDGAHRLHGKGATSATSYREQNQVPLIVVHPGHGGGKRCRAVTSHLDLAPTLVGWSGATSDEKKAAIQRTLPGKDFSTLLAAPEKAGFRAVRDGALYCYNMLAYLDGAFVQDAVGLITQPDGKAKLQAATKQGQLQPDLRKRGAIRSVFDGRYQLTRYFSPTEHNRPTSLDELFRLNDVELFDLEKDPHELDNLALDRRTHAPLLEALNAKLNPCSMQRWARTSVRCFLREWTAAGWRPTRRGTCDPPRGAHRGLRELDRHEEPWRWTCGTAARSAGNGGGVGHRVRDGCAQNRCCPEAAGPAQLFFAHHPVTQRGRPR